MVMTAGLLTVTIILPCDVPVPDAPDGVHEAVTPAALYPMRVCSNWPMAVSLKLEMGRLLSAVNLLMVAWMVSMRSDLLPL